MRASERQKERKIEDEDEEEDEDEDDEERTNERTLAATLELLALGWLLPALCSKLCQLGQSSRSARICAIETDCQ